MTWHAVLKEEPHSNRQERQSRSPCRQGDESPFVIAHEVSVIESEVNRGQTLGYDRPV